MPFVVEADVWDRFPGLRLVVAAGEGLDNRSARPQLARALQEVQAQLRQGWNHPNPQSHPSIAAWRESFRSLGLSGKRFPSSIEALCRRVLGGKGLASINPLVDFYNLVSLRHLVPAGGWDLARLDGDIVLGLSRGGESFRELGHEEAVGVSPGEMSYMAADQVITRHFVWRQSETGKITHDTRRFLLVSEILAAAAEGTALRVQDSFRSGLRELLGVEAVVATLEPSSRRWDPPPTRPVTSRES